MLLLLSFIGSLLFVFGTTEAYNCELLPGDERLDNGVGEKPDTIKPSLKKKRTMANNINEGSKDFMLAFVFIIVVVGCFCVKFLVDIINLAFQSGIQLASMFHINREIYYCSTSLIIKPVLSYPPLTSSCVHNSPPINHKPNATPVVYNSCRSAHSEHSLRWPQHTTVEHTR